MERGDTFHVDLSPVQGREQSGERYVLIVSAKAFHVLGTPLACPIGPKSTVHRKVPDCIVDEVLAKLSTLIE